MFSIPQSSTVPTNFLKTKTPKKPQRNQGGGVVGEPRFRYDASQKYKN